MKRFNRSTLSTNSTFICVISACIPSMLLGVIHFKQTNNYEETPQKIHSYYEACGSVWTKSKGLYIKYETNISAIESIEEDRLNLLDNGEQIWTDHA